MGHKSKLQGTDRLDEEIVFHSTSDDPRDLETFLAQHPEARNQVEALRARYKAVAPGLTAWGAAKDAQRGDAIAAEPSGLPRIPGFKILGELGRGGMGTVYRAEELGPDRLVALKVIPRLGGIEGDRFLREIRAVARVESPHIVTPELLTYT